MALALLAADKLVRMITLSDVAARAGVSISAVSRVLSNAPSTRVSEETRERIKQAARDLDYQPNFAGRALRSARSNIVALIMPDLMNAMFIELVRGVEDAAIAHDYLVLLGRTEDVQPGAESIRKLIGEGRVDAVLLQPGDHPIAPELIQKISGSAPVIFINSVQSSTVGAAILQDELGSRTATQHLIDLGHTRIAMAGGTVGSYTGDRRERGFREAMTDAGLPVDPALVTRLGYTPSDGRTAVRLLLEQSNPPTAIFVANVNAAIGALSELRQAGVRVPDDLSIVAFHDSWTAENTWPPLTTVKMPWHELGIRTFEAVYQRLQGAPVSNIVVDDPAPLLIQRESTRRV